MKMVTEKMNGHLRHPDFLIEVVLSNQTRDVSGFDLILKRKPETYIMLYFFPSFMMVVTSWINFAVSFEAVPGRLGLLLTLFLMMINMNNSISTKIPKSDSACPLIIWILICTVFIILALLEYFIILIKVKYGTIIKKIEAKDKSKKQILKDWILVLDKTSLTLFPPAYFFCVLVFVMVYCIEME